MKGLRIYICKYFKCVLQENRGIVSCNEFVARNMCGFLVHQNLYGEVNQIGKMFANVLVTTLVTICTLQLICATQLFKLTQKSDSRTQTETQISTFYILC